MLSRFIRPYKRNSYHKEKYSIPIKSKLSNLVCLLPIAATWAIWQLPQWQVEPIRHQISEIEKQIKAPLPAAASTSTPTSLIVNFEKIATLEKSRLDAENATRTTLVQAIGGLLLFTTAYISWLNFLSTNDKQVSERFSKALELLGSDNIHARLGGIYALEQIARDAEKKYYRQVMESLTSYLREREPFPNKKAEYTVSNQDISQESIDEMLTALIEDIPPLRTDIQAVITVLKSYLKERKSFSLKKPEKLVANTNISQESIDEMVTALLMDIPKLRTDVQAVITVLSRRKYAYNRGENYRLDLRATDLHELDFPIGTNLQGAIFTGSNLRKAKLDRVILQDADLSHVDFTRTSIKNANLRGANFNLATMERVNLENSDLRSADFNGAKLEKSNLKFANLKDADFSQVKLKNASLIKAQLQRSKFIETDLQMTDFKDANLQEAYFLCDLKETVNITPEQFKKANVPDVVYKNGLPEHLKQD
jgi:uncharacterized protein YjbI with pentapeptide repeats